LNLAPDFNEFFGSLIANGVEFVVVGAHALAFHGAPRFTGDLDVLVRPTLGNARRLLAALEQFGFPAPHLTPETLIAPERLLQMGVEPVQIHVMTDISGVGWDEVWIGRVVGRAGDHEVPFIGREEFLRNKAASGRPKDLADIAALTGDENV
jgi:hypothetical protein